MNYTKVILKPGKEESLKRFHPWVFSGAIHHFEKQPEEGDIIEVTDYKGNFIAIGHYQIGSIAVRILSFEQEIIDKEFLRNGYKLLIICGTASDSIGENKIIHIVLYMEKEIFFPV